MSNLKDIYDNPYYALNMLNALMGILNSTEGKAAFNEMKKDDFSIDWQHVDKEEARILLTLIDLSKAIDAYKQNFNIIPQDIQEGIDNILEKLAPWEDFLRNVANNDNFDREHYIFKQGTRQLNNSFLANKI